MERCQELAGFNQDGIAKYLPKEMQVPLGIMGCGLKGSPGFVSSWVSVSTFNALYCPSSVIHRALMTPSYVARDSECHSSSLNPVVFLWPLSLQESNVLCSGSYVLS